MNDCGLLLSKTARSPYSRDEMAKRKLNPQLPSQNTIQPFSSEVAVRTFVLGSISYTDRSQRLTISMESKQVDRENTITELTPSQVIRGSPINVNGSLLLEQTDRQVDQQGSGAKSTKVSVGQVTSSNTRVRQRRRKKETTKKVEGKAETCEGTERPVKNVDKQGENILEHGTLHVSKSNKSNSTMGQSKNNKRKPKKRKDSGKFSWRKLIPEGAVDPITLDSLSDLLYPPFALCADEPYECLSEWPPRVSLENKCKQDDEEERQRRLLAEQWGQSITGQHPNQVNEEMKVPAKSRQERHYNLFDGRALAYYMVSQLQFIDPLNRRDLTRDELLNLDQYLRRHGFHNLNVTEAYDAKGVSLSTAGSRAATAEGRAHILQEEARNLLNALFSSSSVAQKATSPNNSIMNQYLAHENHQRVRPISQPRQNQNRRNHNFDTGITGSAGFMVIDDSINPGVRSSTVDFNPISSYSARTSSNSNSSKALSKDEFPSLAEVKLSAGSPVDCSIESLGPKASSAQSSKTLSVIERCVRKTDPKEVQRQLEAREEARRKAAVTNLTFGSGPVVMDNQSLRTSSYATDINVSDGQVTRNKILAEALQVLPSVARDGPLGKLACIDKDLFSTELETSTYPESLILQAREKMGLLLKVEKRWAALVTDQKSLSVSLNRMDRATRGFFHEYADYWKLKTESYDPEPQRYIHCSKMLDTRQPFPLLSEVAMNWRKKPPGVGCTSIQRPCSSQVLPLKPFTAVSFETVDNRRFESRIVQEGVPSRFYSDQRASKKPEVISTKEPNLKDENNRQSTHDQYRPISSKDRRSGENSRDNEKSKEDEAGRLRRAIEEAFASDDDNDEHVQRRNSDDESSVWEEQQPLYGDDRRERRILPKPDLVVDSLE